MAVVWIGGEPRTDEERLEGMRLLVEQFGFIIDEMRDGQKP